MTDKTDLIREIHEYVTTHGGENTATHLLVQAASAIQTQAAELEAVGASGYLDLGAALSEDALQQLPKGRHALVIAGTYGIDGYVAAPQPSPTTKPAPQPAPAPLSDDVVRDAAFDAVRKKLCALPRFSFLSDGYGVRRVPDKSGSWIAFDAAHALFDPVAVDAALAAQEGKCPVRSEP